MRKKIRILSIILNLFLVFMVIWAVLHMYLIRGQGNMQVSRMAVFRYFTVDSNILCAVTCLPVVLGQMQVLAGRKEKLSHSVILLKYIGTAAVTLTFLTVMLFLGPLYGYPAMFAGNNLHLHLVCPLAALISFLFLERDQQLSGKAVLLSMLPMLLYGAVYTYKVIIIGAENGGWYDFYGFNAGGRWYISLSAMTLGTFLIGLLLRLLYHAGRRKSS